MALTPESIQALAQALQSLNTAPAPATSVNATSVKLPQFWQGNPEVWFRQVESGLQLETKPLQHKQQNLNMSFKHLITVPQSSLTPLRTVMTL